MLLLSLWVSLSLFESLSSLSLLILFSSRIFQSSYLWFHKEIQNKELLEAFSSVFSIFSRWSNPKYSSASFFSSSSSRSSMSERSSSSPASRSAWHELSAKKVEHCHSPVATPPPLPPESYRLAKLSILPGTHFHSIEKKSKQVVQKVSSIKKWNRPGKHHSGAFRSSARTSFFLRASSSSFSINSWYSRMKNMFRKQTVTRLNTAWSESVLLSDSFSVRLDGSDVLLPRSQLRTSCSPTGGETLMKISMSLSRER